MPGVELREKVCMCLSHVGEGHTESSLLSPSGNGANDRKRCHPVPTLGEQSSERLYSKVVSHSN